MYPPSDPTGQSGGINFSGRGISVTGGEFVGRDKIVINITASPIGKIIKADAPPGPNINVDVKHKFSVSWPPNPDWVPSSRMGAYELSELDVIPSRAISLFFGLVRKEYAATFGIFKIQGSQSLCTGWVMIDIYPKFNDNWIAKLFSKYDLDLMGPAGATANAIRKAGGTIISQQVGSNSVAIEYNPNTGEHPVEIRIISGKHHVYSISSPLYPPLGQYDQLREDTRLILNSFELLA